jgi:hypothetical protein
LISFFSSPLLLSFKRFLPYFQKKWTPLSLKTQKLRKNLHRQVLLNSPQITSLSNLLHDYSLFIKLSHKIHWSPWIFETLYLNKINKILICKTHIKQICMLFWC